MSATRRILPVLAGLAPVLSLSAQSISLAHDINLVSGPGSDSNILPACSDPHGPRPNDVNHFVVLNGVAYFQADDGVHGIELWRSDGTAAGTWLVADLVPGSASSWPQSLFVWNGALYFSADDGTGYGELWRSDGTPGGTTMLSNFSGFGLSPSYFAPASATTLCFRGRTNSTAISWTLWSTDGFTIAQLTPNNAPLDPQEITPLPGGGVVFRSGGAGQLYAATGLYAGHTGLGTAAAPVAATGFVGVGSYVFFAARNNPNTTGLELWRTDGTAAGTFLLRDVLPGTNSGTTMGVSCGHAGIFYFRGNDSSGGGGNHQVWRSDGSVGGTYAVSTAANPLPFVYVMETSPWGLVLGTSMGNYLSNGTFAGTAPIEFTGQVANLKYAAGKLWWRSTSNSNFDQFYVSDGTAGGTHLIGTYQGGPGTGGLSNPAHFAAIGAGSVLCTGNGGHGGFELWRSDGTTTGTWMVKDIRLDGTTSDSAPAHFCEQRAGVTLFSADDGLHGHELWRTDGISTTLVVDLAAGGLPSTPTGLERLGNRVLFAADAGIGLGRELYATDGTSAGTVLVKDLDATPGAGGEPRGLLRVGDRVYFAANDASLQRELFVSDGTAAGTHILVDPDPSSSLDPADLCEVGDSGRFVFAGTTQGDVELWISDGTPAGTHLLVDLVPFNSSGPQGMTRCGDRVVFSAETAAAGRELWITDGTAAGTQLLLDLEPGPNGSWPTQFTNSDTGFCAFVATTTTNGSEIWRTDGTLAGTVLATELTAGAGDRQIENLTWFGNRHLYCQALDAVAGREPFVVRDFTAANSGLLADVYPGAGSSLPAGTVRERPLFQDSFGRLYLAAQDDAHGNELFVITQGAWAKSIDRPCGNGGVKARLSCTPPVLGVGFTFSFRNVTTPPNALHAVLITLGPPPAVDLGGGCRDHVLGGPPVLLGPAVVPGTNWDAFVPLPNAPGLAGLPFAAQTIFAWSSPFDAWSNAVWLQLGY